MSRISLDVAATDELPGSDMPSASATRHIEFAVVIDVQPPHEPHEWTMRSSYSAGSIRPASRAPTLSCAWIWMTSRPRQTPCGM